VGVVGPGPVDRQDAEHVVGVTGRWPRVDAIERRQRRPGELADPDPDAVYGLAIAGKAVVTTPEMSTCTSAPPSASLSIFSPIAACTR